MGKENGSIEGGVSWAAVIYSELLDKQFWLYEDGSIIFKEEVVIQGEIYSSITASYTKEECMSLIGKNNAQKVSYHLMKVRAGVLDRESKLLIPTQETAPISSKKEMSRKRREKRERRSGQIEFNFD